MYEHNEHLFKRGEKREEITQTVVITHMSEYVGQLLAMSYDVRYPPIPSLLLMRRKTHALHSVEVLTQTPPSLSQNNLMQRFIYNFFFF